MSTTIAVLGCGSLGEAIVGGLLAAGTDPSDLVATVRRVERAEEIAKRHHIRAIAENEEPEANTQAVAGAKFVILGVKPAGTVALAREIAPALDRGTLVLSIAAGVGISHLERALPAGQPVARAIPNTPAKLGHGITALAAGTHCTAEHLRLAQDILSAVGKVVEVRETDLDAVTAISGSGPAYVFYLTEALAAAGVELGLSAELAAAAARDAVLGAGPMLTDPSGRQRRASAEDEESTKAGLLKLETAGYSSIVAEAARAAATRAAEITTEQDISDSQR